MSRDLSGRRRWGREERGEEREGGRAREEREGGKGSRERRSEGEKGRGGREREGRGGEERRRKGFAMFLLLQVICRYERVKNWVTGVYEMPA
jgi:hypothetical protein